MTAPTRTFLTLVPTTAGGIYGTHDGRYRVWTAAHGLAFDSMPTREHDGPALVTVNGWYFSTSSTCHVMSSPSVVAADDGMHTARVSRGDTLAETEHHVMHGQKFPTRHDAQRAAYNAGVLGFMVYERHAAGYGLPTEADLDAYRR